MRAALRISVLLAGWGLLFGAPSLQAGWIDNGVPLSTQPTLEIDPAMVSDDSGGAIVVWWDYRNGVDVDLYAQRVGADGSVLWSTQGMPICTQPGDQYAAGVASDGAGGAIITWHDERSCSSCWDIYAQRIDSSGTPLWPVNGVLVCGADGNQTYPHIVSDGLHGAIIAWEDERGLVPADIYAQHVGADGNLLWTANDVAICTAAGVQQYHAMISDGSGGAFIVWQDSRTGGSDYWDIYVQRVSRNGVLQWTGNGLAVCTAVDDQQWPGIVSDGVGGAIIGWSDSRHGGVYDIYAQRIIPPLGGHWTADGVRVCGAPGNQYSPQLATDGEQGAVLAWRDFRGLDMDVYAQRVDANGAMVWTNDGVAICAASGNQFTPQIAPNGLGGAIMAWEDARNGVGAEDVYAQLVDAGGSTLWTEHGHVVSDAPNGQRFVAMTADGRSDPIVAWQDNRTGDDWDIYALTAAFPSSGLADGTPEAGRSEGPTFPNPSGSTVWIPFRLDRSGVVSLRVYDAVGRLVRAVTDEDRAAGEHCISWDGRNEDGREVAGGVYLCRVRGPGLEIARRVIRAR